MSNERQLELTAPDKINGMDVGKLEVVRLDVKRFLLIVPGVGPISEYRNCQLESTMTLLTECTRLNTAR